MADQLLDVQVGLARPEEQADIWDLYQRTYLDTYIDNEAGITRQKLIDFLATDGVYFPNNWQKYLKTPSKKRTVYVARYRGKIVGIVSPVFVEGRHRITALYVVPEMQDMGIGTKLMRTALSHHGNVEVYIGIASHIIKYRQSFYESFGFKVIDPKVLKTYPPDPIAYIEMIRPAATESKSSE